MSLKSPAPVWTRGFCDAGRWHRTLSPPAQAFDEGTIERLRRLSIGVVGASGTGSPVIEVLMHLGVRELVIVDDDTMEERNVDGILNSTFPFARMPPEGGAASPVSTGCQRYSAPHFGRESTKHEAREPFEPETVRSIPIGLPAPSF